MKLLRNTVSPVDADICPRNEIVNSCVVSRLAEPKTVAKARLLPQLCPLQGCDPALIPNSNFPAIAVSAADAARDRMGVAPHATCGVKPVEVPWCTK